MLLCFDYDGVIVDSLAQQLRIVQQARAQLGIGREPSRADFQSIEDLSYDGFAKHIGIPAEQWPHWRETILTLLKSEQELPPAFPDIVPVIRELGSRFPIVIITSNIRQIVEKSLAELALSSSIENIFDGQLRGSKADKIKQASDGAGIPLSSTYMIGDTRGDVRHAKAAGAKSIAAEWGYQSKKILEIEQPDAFAKIPRDLLEFFGVLEVH
ncbi:MAG: HAD family hydrolase [Deltaproteobacteria bacterium]|nr:HAD family hydrolase [Deltaproteobacteria bacterium]